MELALEGGRLCNAGDCQTGVQFFEAAVQAGTDDLKTLSAIYSKLGDVYFKDLDYHKPDLTLARYDHSNFNYLGTKFFYVIGMNFCFYTTAKFCGLIVVWRCCHQICRQAGSCTMTFVLFNNSFNILSR